MTRLIQKQQTRQRVISAATYLISKQGLAAMRTADVAERAGLSHGGIFVHFPTREKLLTEVVSQIGCKITDKLHALISNDAALQQVLEAHIQCLSEHEASYTTFLRESRLLPRDVLRTWVGIQSAISVHMATPAELAMQQSQIRQMPIHLLFNTWVGLVHHYLMNRDLFAPRSSVLKRHGKELIEHFMSLITPM